MIDRGVDEGCHQSPSWLFMIWAFITSQSSTGAFMAKSRFEGALPPIRLGLDE